MTYLCRYHSGVYYYRKTYLLPCGKRKEIRRSLKTADYKIAQFRALKLYFNIAPDREFVGVISDQQSGEPLYAITQPKPSIFQLSAAVKQFLSEKQRTGYWTEREYRRGANMLEALSRLLGTLEVAELKVPMDRLVGMVEEARFAQHGLAGLSISVGKGAPGGPPQIDDEVMLESPLDDYLVGVESASYSASTDFFAEEPFSVSEPQRNSERLREQINFEMARLSPGIVLFNPPSVVTVGVGERVEVRISKKPLESMLMNLKGKGARGQGARKR